LEVLTLEKKLGKEGYNTQMEIYFKDIFVMIINMVMDYILIKMEINYKEFI
jgi:hypothetical protein